MARIRRKKALYEVISRGRLKINSAKPEETSQAEPQKAQALPAADTDTWETTESVAPPEQRRPYWPRKRKLVQFNAGRVELSVPYQVALAAVLMAVVVALVCYRLGQLTGHAAQPGKGPVTPNLGTLEQPPAAKTPEAPRTPEVVTPFVPDMTEKAKRPDAPVSTGNNVIILAQCDNRKDLEPVVQHFAKHNIELEVRQRGSKFVLVTKKRYDSTGGKGSDSAKDLDDIIRIGGLYKDKAPLGYGTFAPHYFSDAYKAKAWY
jgi:hypothetical protein